MILPDLEIFNVDQGSPEWFACRLGVPTASMFQTVLATGKFGDDSKGRRTYLYKLVGERITGQPSETYTNQNMERGKVMEEEGCNLYSLLTGAQLDKVGFMRRGDIGCSPDRLIGADGMLQMKTHVPHIHLQIIEAGELPPENKAQVHGELMVSGRAWSDFVSYWPRLPIFIKRVYRDEHYIARLRVALGEFVDEIRSLEARFRAMAA